MTALDSPTVGVEAAPPTVGAPLVAFDAIGRPTPQGSKKAWLNKKTNRVQMREQTSEHLTPWRDTVTGAARAAMRTHAGSQLPPLDGPLAVRMVFTMKKPAGAPKTRRTWPAVTPDVSKLCRAAEDALTTAGLWTDDARVVEYDRLAKVYPGEDPEALDVPGVRISVRQVIA